MTGSTGRYIIEFGVPADMEQWTESDLRTMKQRVEFEVSDEDLNAWDELAKVKGFKALLSTTVKGAVAAVEKGNGAAASSTGKSASELLAEKNGCPESQLERHAHKVPEPEHAAQSHED